MTKIEILRELFLASDIDFEDYEERGDEISFGDGANWYLYDPTENDLECVALVKKFKVLAMPEYDGSWIARIGNLPAAKNKSSTWNLAVCRAVVQYLKSKKENKDV